MCILVAGFIVAFPVFAHVNDTFTKRHYLDMVNIFADDIHTFKSTDTEMYQSLIKIYPNRPESWTLLIYKYNVIAKQSRSEATRFLRNVLNIVIYPPDIDLSEVVPSDVYSVDYIVTSQFNRCFANINKLQWPAKIGKLMLGKTWDENAYWCDFRFEMISSAFNDLGLSFGNVRYNDNFKELRNTHLYSHFKIYTRKKKYTHEKSIIDKIMSTKTLASLMEIQDEYEAKAISGDIRRSSFYPFMLGQFINHAVTLCKGEEEALTKNYTIDLMKTIIFHADLASQDYPAMDKLTAVGPVKIVAMSWLFGLGAFDERSAEVKHKIIEITRCLGLSEDTNIPNYYFGESKILDKLIEQQDRNRFGFYLGTIDLSRESLESKLSAYKNIGW